MPDFSKVSWIDISNKPGVSGPQLRILYERKWYLVPFVPGGWKDRVRYTPTTEESAQIQARIHDHEPPKALWDTVTNEGL